MQSSHPWLVMICVLTVLHVLATFRTVAVDASVISALSSVTCPCTAPELPRQGVASMVVPDNLPYRVQRPRQVARYGWYRGGYAFYFGLRSKIRHIREGQPCCRAERKAV